MKQNTFGQIMQYNWSDYAIKIFFTVMNRHSNAKAVVFVNDPYDITDLVKGEEHLRRNYINWSKNIYRGCIRGLYSAALCQNNWKIFGLRRAKL